MLLLLYLYLFSDNKNENQNLQQYVVKYVKQIKPQHKVKPSHSQTGQIRSRSQKNLTLGIHLEKEYMLHLHFKPNQAFI